MNLIKIKYASLAAGFLLAGSTVLPIVQVLYAQAPPPVPADGSQTAKKQTAEPRQVSITSAIARVSEADLKASGINYDLVPAKPSSQKMYRFYATGTRASHFFQKLSAQKVVTEAPTVTTVDDVTATVSISTPLPQGKVTAQQLTVIPHINADNSVTLRLYSVFEDSMGRSELSTTRTIKNRDTIAILMPNFIAQPGGEYRIYFVTPTIK